MKTLILTLVSVASSMAFAKAPMFSAANGDTPPSPPLKPLELTRKATESRASIRTADVPLPPPRPWKSALVDSHVDKAKPKATKASAAPLADPPDYVAPLPPRRPSKKELENASERNKSIVCTDSFEKARQLIKNYQHADIAALGKFPCKFKDNNPTCTLKPDNGRFVLNLDLGLIAPDVPITICQNGKKLIAKLLISRARDPNTKKPDQQVAQMVKDKDLPRTLEIEVTRVKDQLRFAGQHTRKKEDGSLESIALRASAAIK